MKKIKFPKRPKDATLIYNGRNGIGYCKGIQLEESYDDSIRVYPVNSRGNTSNCWVSIDKDSIDDVIKALEAMKS